MRIDRLSPLQGLQIIPICRQLPLLNGVEQASAQLEHVGLSQITGMTIMFKQDHSEHAA